MGVTGRLKGFFYATYMIRLIEQDPMAATLVTKLLYPETAKRFGATDKAVEHGLRTVINTCWKMPNHDMLDEVAGMHLTQKPTNSRFLDMAAAYLRRQGQD